MDTAQPQVSISASTPPIIFVKTADFNEQPHVEFDEQEYVLLLIEVKLFCMKNQVIRNMIAII